MASISGFSDTYTYGQCTYGASQQYYNATGYWVPATWGDAYTWATNATKDGWQVSSTPVAPSIICLQPGVQGASPSAGHVAVVTSANASQVQTINLNWGANPGSYTNVTFTPGPGVSFIYAVDQNGKIAGGGKQVGSVVSAIQTALQTNSPVSLAPNEDVSAFLVALDTLLELRNPFQNINAPQDSIAGISFTDPIGWAEGFGLNLIEDLGAGIIRAGFLILGMAIIINIASHFINFNAIMQTGQQAAKLAPLLL